jgi:hypothetical protein
MSAGVLNMVVGMAIALHVRKFNRRDSEFLQNKRITLDKYNIGAPHDGPTWASSNTGVATVDAYGTVTAIGAGDATITATVAANTTNVTGGAPTFAVHVVADDNELVRSFVIEVAKIDDPSLPATGS